MPNANLDKGKRAERDVAKYLITQGITARRHGNTGRHVDIGDLELPGICTQIKDWTGVYPRGIPSGALREVMAETMRQCDAAGAVVPLIIEKRHRVASPAEWWSHLPANIYAALITGCDPTAEWMIGQNHIVRVELQYIIEPIKRMSELCAGVAA